MAIAGSGVNAMQMWIENDRLHETKSSCAGSLAVEDVEVAVDRLMAGEKLYVLLYGMTVPNVRSAVNERLKAYTHTPEPPPTGDGAIVLERAIYFATRHPSNEWLELALRRRAADGLKKYGTYLRTNNGRNALVDYLQEQLDAIMYAVQAYEEHPSIIRRSLLNSAIDAAVLAYKVIQVEKESVE